MPGARAWQALDGVLMRDSKGAGGTVVAVQASAWRCFVGALSSGAWPRRNRRCLIDSALFRTWF
ncbi:DUF397 domain-containing protein [Streptomyces sp. NPDC085927]|uniref:DUF397 domain-containing protein n=1 Tax=Streptomyces sp. NPDC085927 TaxID=3365738 RepID=UPI0037CCF48F